MAIEQKILREIEGIKKLLDGRDEKDEFYIKNFDENRLGLKKELLIHARYIKGIIDKIIIPKKVEVSNLPKQPDTIKVEDVSKLIEIVNDLRSIITQIEPNITVEAPKIPEIKVPEIRVPKVTLPKITVPEPKVTVNPQVDLDLSELLEALEPLRYLSDRPGKPISVRMSDGVRWLRAIKKAEGNIVRAFAAGGMTADEWKAAYKSVTVYSKFNHGAKSSIGTSAVQITQNSIKADNGVLVKAANGNSGIIYAGNSDVTNGTTDATDGYELNKGESIVMPIDNANKVYVIGSASGQKVFWVVV